MVHVRPPPQQTERSLEGLVQMLTVLYSVTISPDSQVNITHLLLGTSLVCSFLEIGMSFVQPRILKRIFPPIVTGTVILLIGASLIGESGILNWGGGSNDCHLRPESGFFRLCPNISAPRPLP
jgi:xanthine/uracil permease